MRKHIKIEFDYGETEEELGSLKPGLGVYLGMSFVVWAQTCFKGPEGYSIKQAKGKAGLISLSLATLSRSCVPLT